MSLLGPDDTWRVAWCFLPPYGGDMKQLIAVLTAAFVLTAFAQPDLEVRVAELEERVAQLEALLVHPAPPPTTQEVDGFVFTRLRLNETSSYTDVFGEVTSEDEFQRVTFRVTLYAENGSIIDTGTFSVENVGSTPRVFESPAFWDVLAADVESIGLQVERTR